MTLDIFENETKYLPANDTWRGLVTKSLLVEQGYLLHEGNKVARIRITTHPDGMRVPKFEIKLPRTSEGVPEYPLSLGVEMADMMMRDCGERIIRKIRHHVYVNDRLFEIDEFQGRYQPLVLIELERKGAQAEVMELPTWVGRNVTDDIRFANIWLAEHLVESNMLGFQP